MKALRCAALALAVAGLSAQGTETTNAWWKVDFQSPTPVAPEGEVWPQGYGGVNLPVDEGTLGALTNNYFQNGAQQPYLAGFWTMEDGDESYITNSFNATNLSGRAFGGDNCIKLDTQGNDLTWTVDTNPQNDHTMADGLKALVDADLYLVGSDSPPDASDFDAASDVQTAVYLKNETDEDSGETTNSVLCVYVYDENAEVNYWQELDGPELKDNSWARVQVIVDHSDDANKPPVVQVYVNGTPMHARNGTDTSWTAANGPDAQTAGRVSSVAFRGTGAVDNFVGKTIEEVPSFLDFTAAVYMNNVLVPADSSAANKTTTLVNREVKSGSAETFEGFTFDNWKSAAVPATWCLTKVIVVDPVTSNETAYTYTYDRTGVATRITADQAEGNPVTFATRTMSGQTRQTGAFIVEVPTEGAKEDMTIVKIYFEDLPVPGDFTLTATQNVGTAPESQKFNTNTLSVASTTFEFDQAISDGGTSYILSTIVVGEAPAGIEAAVSGTKVVVTVPLNDQIAEGSYNVAAATYVEGSLAEGQELQGSRVGNTYTYTAVVPPVAMIGETPYESLRDAITNATPGDTIYLVADDRVSFTADDPILDIDFEVTIVGGSNTLYGMTDYAGLHEIRISGSDNVTIKDLKLSEFGDTAPLSQSVMPICTRAAYEGKLVLDGVTIDKFNRQALLLCGGEFLITNSVITGCAGEEGKTSYFQSAIETYYAKGDVGDTTITGIGALNAGGPTPDDEWVAAVFTVNPLAGADGTVKVTSGYYEGQFIVAFNPGSVGAVTLEGGTFVATVAGTESAFLDDSEGGSTLTISGGWFDREPEAKYIAEGLAAYEDAPGTDAPWTVRAAKVAIDFYVDGAIYATTSVVVGATGYAPADPEKASDAQYAYAFTGWTNVVGESYSAATLPAATTATNYYAAFSVVVRSYEVEWVVDGVYTTNTWNYNATPSWNENDATAVPTKDPTDATNFTFKAWDPEVVAVTGFASYTATWTETARTYAITFQTNGVDYATVDAEWHATGYAPADPAAPEGKVFKGWALSTAPTTVLDTLPEVSGAATYVAVFDDDAVEVHVNPGDGLDTIENAPAPIEFTAAGLCKIAFKAPAAGKYVLMTSETVNGTYLAEGTPVEFAAGALVELTETTAGTTKFFKIGYEK